MNDRLHEFITPSEPYVICNTEFASETDARAKLTKKFAEQHTVKGLRANRDSFIEKGETPEKKALLGEVITQAIAQAEQAELSSNTQVTTGKKVARAVDLDMLDGGYTGMKRVETQPADWVWMAAKGTEAGAVFYHLDDPYSEVPAKVMNARVPKRHWAIEQDAEGQPILRNNVPSRVRPSESHLGFDHLRIKNVTMDPWRKETVYVNDFGDQILNQYRPIKFPPRPEPKYFQIVEIAKKWLEFLYPGRSEYILDHFSHMLRSLETKASTHLVFGGGQGIGKGVLISLCTYTHSRQGKVSVIEKTQLEMPHTDYLMRPILFVDEFELRRGDRNYPLVKDRLKAWTGSSEKHLAVHPKGRPATHVANIHRLIIATNYPNQIPRDNDDRRYAIMNSAVTEEQVLNLITPLFAALDAEVAHPNFSFQRLWEEGYGDAFAHFLLDREFSEGFNPNRLPRDLLDQYDENSKGHEIPESMRLALDEIALTFGGWDHSRLIKSTEVAPWPKDIEDIKPEHWPKFVAAQQLYATHSARFDEVDGERILDSKNLDTLCNNANYIFLKSDGKQWRGKIPSASAAEGAVRVQTKLYYRRDAFPNGTKKDELQVAALKFIESLTEYWRTDDGVKSYWSDQRCKDELTERSMRSRDRAQRAINDEKGPNQP